MAETPVAGASSAAAPITPADAGAGAVAEPSTPGRRLKAARERRGLSLQKAADKMHLDQWVIEALESDEFDKVGPSVYVKGHLKHYAVMLGVPAAEVMTGYGSSELPAAAQRGNLRMRTQEPVGIELPWGTIAAAAVVAVGILGLVWLRPWRPRAASAPAIAAPTTTLAAANPIPANPDPEPEADDLPATPAPAPMPEAPSVKAPASQRSPPMSAVASASGPSPATRASGVPAATAIPASGAPAAGAPPVALPGSGRTRLRLSFSADSHVDVRDANGNSVFAGNGRANSVKTISGDAPLRVFLGAASGVQLAINDRVVAIGPQFFAGDSAHFEAGADGVLRRDAHSASTNTAAPHEPRPRG